MSELVPIIPAALDEANLSPAEFRVFCHLCRRAGGREAWPSAESVAHWCNLNPNTVWRALRKLEALNMIFREARPGRSTLYFTRQPSEWHVIRKNPPQKSRYLSDWGTTHPKRVGGYPPQKSRYEGYPVEGCKSKDIHLPSPNGSGEGEEVCDFLPDEIFVHKA